MKKMNKIVSVLLAVVMVLAMSVTTFAAGTGSITITPPTNIDADATNTYKIYKVFDADGDGTGADGKISYKLVEGKDEAPAGFSVDEAGNVTYDGTGSELTEADIAAIAAYVTEDDVVATVTSVGSAAAVASGLANGYYYITTSTGSVVTINSTNPNANVNDKNTVPTLNKEITGANSLDENGEKALAQVGTDVEYKVTIVVGKGAVNYKFHDKMGSGLSYNNDVAISGIDSTQYDVQEDPDEGDTITIAFADGIAAGIEIVITYSAKITSDALTTEPAKNTASISYGDNYNYTTTESETSVYNAKFTVTKQDGNENPLAGAGFVIANAEGKYYNLTDNVVTWVDSIEDATEYISDENGAVTAFTGLADGTYTLIEKTVPSGYNKAADSEFTIAKGDYTAKNLEQTTTVTNNAGTLLPSTGGMGTTIIYVVGGILVLAAVVLLFAKRRVEEN